MGLATIPVRDLAFISTPCRLVVRKDRGLNEVAQFILEGVQIGQPLVALAGAGCLKEIAASLTEAGLKPDSLLRNGRLIFLTAPDCLPRLTNPDDPANAPFRRGGPLMRWISDWSWAYSEKGWNGELVRQQRCVHDFVRSLGALSLCTAHSTKLERGSLLALLADHRRMARC